jgi:hypothetical protein
VTVLAPYPDIELVMLDLLRPLGKTVTATDAVIDPPVVVVQRVGGTDDGVTDRPVVQITCLHTSRSAAWAMARQAQQIVLAAGGNAVSGTYVTGVFIDSARTVTPPDQLTDRNANLRPVSAQYRLGLRRTY